MNAKSINILNSINEYFHGEHDSVNPSDYKQTMDALMRCAGELRKGDCENYDDIRDILFVSHNDLKQLNDMFTELVCQLLPDIIHETKE